MSRLNPLVTFVLRAPVLHWLLSPGLVLLTVTGRRSGRRYTIPVGYQRSGDIVTVMVSKARSKQWWRNYRAPGPVVLQLRGQRLTGTARLAAPDSDAFREAAESTLRRVPGMGRVFKVDFDRRVGLTDSQVAALAHEIAVVQIELTPGRGSG